MTVTVHPVREFLGMPVDPDTEPRDLRALELSTRSYTALHSAGYSTIDELMELSEDDLLEIPGLAARGAQEVLRRLIPYREEGFDIALQPNAGEGFVVEDEDLALPPEGEEAPTPNFVEEWRPIAADKIVAGHTVSNTGKVKSPNGRELSRLATVKSRQPYISLRRADKPSQSTSARLGVLVLEAFVSLRPKGKDVLYKDGNFDNCHLSNLCWERTDHPDFQAQRRTAAMKAAATRAAAKADPKGKKRGPKPLTPVPLGEVSVEHTYRCGQVAITVNDSNLGNWPTGLSTPQDRADALKVLQQINDMDKLMGLV